MRFAAHAGPHAALIPPLSLSGLDRSALALANLHNDINIFTNTFALQGIFPNSKNDWAFYVVSGRLLSHTSKHKSAVNFLTPVYTSQTCISSCCNQMSWEFLLSNLQSSLGLWFSRRHSSVWSAPCIPSLLKMTFQFGCTVILFCSNRGLWNPHCCDGHILVGTYLSTKCWHLVSTSSVSTTSDFRSLMRIQNSTGPVTADICWKLPQLVVILPIHNNSFEIPLLLFAPQLSWLLLKFCVLWATS